MTTPLKFTANLEIWLRVFAEVTEQDPNLVLNEDTHLNFEGADKKLGQEFRILGAFKLITGEFLIITFTTDGSWGDISEVKFERNSDIDSLQLPSGEELDIIRFHDHTHKIA